MLYVGNLNNLASGYTQAGLHHLASLAATGYTDFGIFSRLPIPWNTFPRWCDGLRSLPTNTSRDPVLVHSTSDQLASTLARPDTSYIGMTAIDTDRCPKWAAVAINRTFKRLIVPSTHSAAAAEKGGIKIPISIVPHTMHESLWTSTPRLTTAAFHKEWVFYYIGSWNARKNPEDLIRAYVRAFPTDDCGVRLSMKLTAPEGIKYVALDLIASEMAKLGRPLPEDTTRRDIVINCGNVSATDIIELHAYGDCYVSPHRGEAFGIAAFEAALLGKSVVYTDYSGVRDFVSRDRGDYPIAYSMVRVEGMSGMAHYSSSMEWAQPDIDDLVSALRVSASIRRGARADGIRDTFSYANCGTMLKTALEV